MKGITLLFKRSRRVAGAFSAVLLTLYEPHSEIRILDAGCGLGFLSYVAAKGLWVHKGGKQIFLAPIDQQGRIYSTRVASVLRSIGLKVDLNVMERGISKQLDYASKMGYEYVVILGENEAKKETVSLKILSSGQQKEIPIRL